MTKKKTAYLKTEEGFRIVTVYQAIKIKNNQIKNRDSELLFYDSPNEEIGELMFPKRTSSNGREAHFSYYPNSTHSGIASEMSTTHTIYELAIVNIKKLRLYIWGEEIILYIKQALPEYFIRTENNSYFVDIYLILQGTEPKSFYYKWGGKIAIEICVTHKVNKSKVNDLESKNIQVCEIKIYDNQYIPNNICNEKEILHYIKIVKNRLLNYKNVGKLLNDVNPPKGTEWEMRYLKLKQYEQEIMKLEKMIQKNEEKIHGQQENIEQNARQIRMLERQEMHIKEEIKMKEMKLGEVEYTLSSIEKQKRENQELIEQNYDLENQVKELQKSLEVEQEKGFLKRLFNKYVKQYDKVHS